jgi:hypothetical protein
MSHNNEKTLYLSGNNFIKASHHFKKASIPLKMSSKSLVVFLKASILIKASISLKIFSKSLDFKKGSHL